MQEGSEEAEPADYISDDQLDRRRPSERQPGIGESEGGEEQKIASELQRARRRDGRARQQLASLPAVYLANLRASKTQPLWRRTRRKRSRSGGERAGAAAVDGATAAGFHAEFLPDVQRLPH
jgi:hypothetical protein